MGRPRMEGGQGGRRGIGGLKTVLVLTSPGSNQKVPHDARSRTNSDFQRDGVPTTVPLQNILYIQRAPAGYHETQVGRGDTQK